MQKKELTQANANPYMRPMGRSSLISASAPFSPVLSGYTPNEPEYEASAFISPLKFAVKPPVEESVKSEEEERDPVEIEEPLFDASPFFRKESPAVPSDVEKDPPEEAPARFFVELPQEQPSPKPRASAVEEEEIVPPEEETDYAAAYAQSLAENQEQDIQEEAVQEATADEELDGEEPLQKESAAEETDSETDAEEETLYEYDPAYYAAYWQQWQAAMEAHQAATCSACPLMNGQRGKVCLVPVIIPDQSETPVEPKAVFTMMEQAGQKEERFPATQAAAEEKIPAAEDLPMRNALEEDDDDEDFFGEDVIASENMPKPQTVPVELPQIGETKKRGRVWPLVLLAILVLAGAGLFITSKLGVLEDIVNWLGLPQSVVDFLGKAGLL